MKGLLGGLAVEIASCVMRLLFLLVQPGVLVSVQFLQATVRVLVKERR